MSKVKQELRLVTEVPPTINHCYYRTRSGGKRLTPLALAWVERTRNYALQECIRQGWRKKNKGVKIVAEITTYFPDNRRRDTHNGDKIWCDALEGIVYTDDRWLLVRHINWEVDSKNPRREAVFYLYE